VLRSIATPSSLCILIYLHTVARRYTPNDYPTEVEWSGRFKLEHSFAVKCPCVAYHLAGTKKVQQKLAEPGEVEKFVSNPEDAQALRF
jgi:glutathione synthase